MLDDVATSTKNAHIRRIRRVLAMSREVRATPDAGWPPLAVEVAELVRLAESAIPSRDTIVAVLTSQPQIRAAIGLAQTQAAKLADDPLFVEVSGLLEDLGMPDVLDRILATSPLAGAFVAELGADVDPDVVQAAAAFAAGEHVGKAIAEDQADDAALERFGRALYHVLGTRFPELDHEALGSLVDEWMAKVDELEDAAAGDAPPDYAGGGQKVHVERYCLVSLDDLVADVRVSLGAMAVDFPATMDAFETLFRERIVARIVAEHADDHDAPGVLHTDAIAVQEAPVAPVGDDDDARVI